MTISTNNNSDSALSQPPEQSTNLKTIKIPIEFQKPLHSQSSDSNDSSIPLTEQVVSRLMDYQEESVARGYMTVHIPIPPQVQFEDPKLEKCVPSSQDKFHQAELARLTKSIQKQVERTGSQQDDSRDQWLARALKRNPSVLYLSERLRPLSKQKSNSAILYQQQSSTLRTPGGGSKKNLSKYQNTVGSDPNSPRVLSSNAGSPFDSALNQSGANTSSGNLTQMTDQQAISSGRDSTLLTSNGSVSNLRHLIDLTNANDLLAGDVSSGDDDKLTRRALDFSDILNTTENRDVLSRETLLQLVYQHLSQRGLYQSIKTIEEESGIKYNGMRDDQTDLKDSLITTLLSMGIKDIEHPYILPPSDLANLDRDVEIQTASVYHHFDEDHVEDIKKPFWTEILDKNEEDNIEMTGEELKGATLNKLVEKLTGADADSKFVQCFLITYRSFTVPEILLQKLCQRYRTPKSTPNDLQIQLRTGALLCKWIDDFFSIDWSDNMIRELTVFTEDYLLKHKTTFKMGGKILTKLTQNLAKRKKEAPVIFSDTAQPPVVPNTVFSPKLSIWDIKEEELAKQLTFMDHNLYRNIGAHELLNCAWSKPKLKHRSKNLIQSIDFFNRLSNWFTCQIVNEESFRERKAKIAKLMNIAKAMYKLNNFNSLMALTSAYENAAVHRLKLAIGDIDERTKEDFSEACKVMSPDASFRTYRTYIKQHVKPPLNVYLGIYLTDLTFIEDGNPDFIKHTKTQRSLINWRKRQMVANVVSEVMQYKNPPYNIQQVYQIQELLRTTLANHEPIDDKALFATSNRVEPRNARKEDLKQ